MDHKSYIESDVTFRGSSVSRYLRFVESAGQFNGAYVEYEGATNKLHLGVHAAADNNSANDTKVITMQRSDGFIGLNNTSPSYNLDITGTFNCDGARIESAFTNIPARLAIVNPSFGGSRLGDSALQTPSLDIGTSINFINGTTAQQVDFAIFQNNDVMTVRSLGGNHVGVFDFNGGNQAVFGTDDAEATFAATLNYTTGESYVSDVGVQRYEPGVSIVAKSFFDVMINNGGAPRMEHIKTYYDGTTYDVIRTIAVDGIMTHTYAVRGIEATDPSDFVTLSQLETPTGLEQITETGRTGWRFIGKDPANYGNIGTGAVDLSSSTVVSALNGARGFYSLVGGQNTVAGGSHSFSMGFQTAANSIASIALGRDTVSSGESAMAVGRDMQAYSFAEMAMGLFGTSYSPVSTSGYNALDRVLSIGIGQSDVSRADAFTILKNGNTGIGIDNFESNDSGDKLQVAGNANISGVVRTNGYTVATLPAGTIGDRAYVTDATAPTYLGTLTGGGSVVCPVFFNGTAWVSA